MAVASVGTTRTNDVRYDTLYYLMSFYVMLCHVILCHVTLNVWCHRSTLRVLSSCSIPFPPPCSPSFSSFIPYLSTTPHPPPSFPPLILFPLSLPFFSSLFPSPHSSPLFLQSTPSSTSEKDRSPCGRADGEKCSSPSAMNSCEEMTMDEIFNGKGKYYPGLIPLVYAYLDYIRWLRGSFIVIVVAVLLLCHSIKLSC